MSDTLFTKHVKLIELDAILDTRLTIYKQLEMDVDAIFKEGYRNRVYDRFPEVDYDKYMELYKNRNNDMLLAATVTELLYIINKEGRGNFDTRKAMGLAEINEVWINLYPYDLNEGQAFQIGKAVSVLLKGSGYSVKTVRYPYEELTLQFLEENYIKQYYVYQYEQWLEPQVPTLLKDKNHYAVSVIAPWLITADLTEETTESLDEMIASGTSPAEILRSHFAPWFSLELTKSRLFSSIMSTDVYPDYINQD